MSERRLANRYHFRALAAGRAQRLRAHGQPVPRLRRALHLGVPVRVRGDDGSSHLADFADAPPLEPDVGALLPRLRAGRLPGAPLLGRRHPRQQAVLLRDRLARRPARAAAGRPQADLRRARPVRPRRPSRSRRAPTGTGCRRRRPRCSRSRAPRGSAATSRPCSRATATIERARDIARAGRDRRARVRARQRGRCSRTARTASTWAEPVARAHDPTAQLGPGVRELPPAQGARPRRLPRARSSCARTGSMPSRTTCSPCTTSCARGRTRTTPSSRRTGSRARTSCCSTSASRTAGGAWTTCSKRLRELALRRPRGRGARARRLRAAAELPAGGDRAARRS